MKVTSFNQKHIEADIFIVSPLPMPPSVANLGLHSDAGGRCIAVVEEPLFIDSNFQDILYEIAEFMDDGGFSFPSQRVLIATSMSPRSITGDVFFAWDRCGGVSMLLRPDEVGDVVRGFSETGALKHDMSIKRMIPGVSNGSAFSGAHVDLDGLTVMEVLQYALENYPPSRAYLGIDEDAYELNGSLVLRKNKNE